MNKVLFLFSIIFSLNVTANAATTPIDTKLTDNSITTIECELKSNNEFSDFPEAGRPKPGVYHYKLYIPKGYNENNQIKYPLLSIASPGGNANISNVKEYVERHRWVVIMLVESSNKTRWNVMAGNAVAAHDDVMKRVRIQDGFKFATGFSGGSRGANQLLSLRKNFGGMIHQGAGFWWIEGKGDQYQWKQLNPEAFFYAIFGHKDGNCSEISRLIKNIKNGYLKIDLFDGGHSWAPKEHMERALDWLTKKTVINGKTCKKDKGIYYWYINKQMEILNETQSGFKKYEIKEDLIDFVKKHKITLDDTLKEKIPEWKSELKLLKKDDTIKKELSAKKAYLKVVKAESKPIKSSKKSKRKKKAESKNPLESLADDYEAVAKKYEGMVYSEKASTRAKSLRLQATLSKYFASN